MNKEKHKKHHRHTIDTMDEVVEWSDFAFPWTEKLTIISEKIFHTGIKSLPKNNDKLQRRSDMLYKKGGFRSIANSYFASLSWPCISYGYFNITSALFGPGVQNITGAGELIVNMMIFVCIVSRLILIN